MRYGIDMFEAENQLPPTDYGLLRSEILHRVEAMRLQCAAVLEMLSRHEEIGDNPLLRAEQVDAALQRLDWATRRAIGEDAEAF